MKLLRARMRAGVADGMVEATVVRRVALHQLYVQEAVNPHVHVRWLHCDGMPLAIHVCLEAKLRSDLDRHAQHPLLMTSFHDLR